MFRRVLQRIRIGSRNNKREEKHPLNLFSIILDPALNQKVHLIIPVNPSLEEIQKFFDTGKVSLEMQRKKISYYLGM